jgi:hypothetical protein
MILLDANLLLYAYDARAKHHAASRVWLERVLSEPERVALTSTVILAFLRISTDFHILAKPLGTDEAIEVIARLLGQPQVVQLSPGERYWDIFRQLLVKTGAAGKLVMDAHLAALAIEHNATLCTADHDFKRFAGLRWHYPLEESGA